MPAAGVEADTLRPRNEPTPLNRQLPLAAVPSPTPDPSRDLADRSREGPTGGIAVPSISPVPRIQRHCGAFRLPLSEAEIQTAPRVSSAPRTDLGKLRLSSCEAAAISPRNLVTARAIGPARRSS